MQTDDNFNQLVNSFLSDGSRSHGTPQFVLLMGGVGSGKTTMRKSDFGNGYVSVDGGDIFRLIAGQDSDNVDRYLPEIDRIGSELVAKALNERRNIVMELIGDNEDEVTQLIDIMTARGYKCHLQFVDCDPAEAYKRHIKATSDDKLYLSCYFTKDLHHKWLMQTN